jgi:hypothetical protein
LPGSARCLRAAEVIEHHRYGRRRDMRPQSVDHRQVGIDLEVPRPALESFRCFDEAPPARVRIRDPGGGQVQPDAANTAAMHVVQSLVGCVGVDHRDAPGARSELPYSVERAGVVRAVDARLDYHDPVHVEGAVQRAHFLD